MSLVNPLQLDCTELLVWGLAAHVIADWLFQSDWMAAHKAQRGGWPRRHPPATDYDSPTEVLATRMQARTDELRPVKTPPWWNRHPAAYVHAGAHLLAFVPLLGLASLPLAVVHLVIDTRAPVEWWARLVGQTRPIRAAWLFRHGYEGDHVALRGEATATLRDHPDGEAGSRESQGVVVDLGLLVRMAVDQAFHVATIMVAALLAGSLA